MHVLQALADAEQHGYKTLINKNEIAELLVWDLERSSDFNEKARILKTLHLLGSQINYTSYIANLEKTKNVTLNGLLHIIELKQLCGIKYNLDTLAHYKKSTLMGNVFYADGDKRTHLLNNDIQNTLLAYQIFKTHQTDDTGGLNSIRNYFFEKRENAYWRNTFESAQIIEAVLPDLLKNKSEINKPVLTIKGEVDKTIRKFPFQMQLLTPHALEVSKSGDSPIYFTSYQTYWNPKPSIINGDFEISTSFNSKQKTYLPAGQQTKLIANVTIKKNAEYVMINIPIPAGCSYADKTKRFKNESHREYFKNETTIFCDYLAEGEYTFEIDLVPRYSGTYTINPAKVECMYFPTFNANNQLKTIVIK